MTLQEAKYSLTDAELTKILDGLNAVLLPAVKQQVQVEVRRQWEIERDYAWKQFTQQKYGDLIQRLQGLLATLVATGTAREESQS